MKQSDSRVTDEIEKFKLKLADELGIIEQTDRKTLSATQLNQRARLTTGR